MDYIRKRSLSREESSHNPELTISILPQDEMIAYLQVIHIYIYIYDSYTRIGEVV